ncbi:universal stress protein [Paenibacillus sp. TRM 82003]|uniref:universal stress protein n=1 Tax=Kineococcus sp. TRM81007 TaxID=2925831 RepID=UPI001F57C224|nr:universal stress protein [Kineococcus sp. TRM81007]MCI2237268.1 universal stress protein [Kineococcus sp. TRM81007]MCI3919327.1 universal stress protein [Paenibacillus sp. TRM 82003]
MSSSGGRVVVGVEEVGTAAAALRWAAAEARRRGAALHLVRAVPYPVAADAATAWVVAGILEDLEAAARAVLEDAAALVRAEAPDVDVAAAVERGGPRPVLLRAAEGAAVVVSGSRRQHARRWSVPGLRLGSTSLFLAAHAPCPTAVVAEEAPAGARGVVVGFDGSVEAAAALEVAAAEAEALGEELRVVHAVHLQLDPSLALEPGLCEQLRRDAVQRAREVVRAAVGEVGARHPVPVEQVVVADAFASDALLDAARGARLLVVGSRGHGAFLRALLGSTSHAVLQRAQVPVLVVPDPERARAHRREDGLASAAG